MSLNATGIWKGFEVVNVTSVMKNQIKHRQCDQIRQTFATSENFKSHWQFVFGYLVLGKILTALWQKRMLWGKFSLLKMAKY